MTADFISDAEHDNFLIKQTLEGNKDAFQPLVHKYWKQVYFLTLRYVKNPETASDLTQETFITVFSKLDNFIVGKSFRPWLFKIAINKSLTLLQKNKQLKTIELQGNESFDDSDNPETLLSSKQLLDECLDKLRLDDQVVFILRHSLELSYEEMAIILDKPIGSVKGELFRARGKLKAHFFSLRERENEKNA